MSNRAASTAAVLLFLAGCRAQPSEPRFPTAQRDVAPIVGTTFSTEDARDRAGEAEEVMQLAGVKPGMSVADVGAGEGYYTVRLARVVGTKGRVLAEDIIPEVRDQLSDRAERAPGQCRRQAGHCRQSHASGRFIRPDFPGAHVSRGPVTLRIPLAHARKREARRPGDRGRFQSAGEAAWNASRRAQVRVCGPRVRAAPVQCP